jgi:hypothetical protein
MAKMVLLLSNEKERGGWFNVALEGYVKRGHVSPLKAGDQVVIPEGRLSGVLQVNKWLRCFCYAWRRREEGVG